MNQAAKPLMVKTTTDLIFDQLYDEISSLALLPGTRMSEAEIAERLGVSRQPVRDAFNRLANLDLLLVRPQRATVVRGFSMEKIENARFVRLAVELEVITRGCSVWTEEGSQRLAANIARHTDAINAGRIEEFHSIDFDFHKLICEFSGQALAFETIERCKHSIDRLCVLSLQNENEAEAIVEDHQAIARALEKGSVEDARATTKHHLSRLDQTVQDIHKRHAQYFE